MTTDKRNSLRDRALAANFALQATITARNEHQRQLHRASAASALLDRTLTVLGEAVEIHEWENDYPVAHIDDLTLRMWRHVLEGTLYCAGLHKYGEGHTTRALDCLEDLGALYQDHEISHQFCKRPTGRGEYASDQERRGDYYRAPQSLVDIVVAALAPGESTIGEEMRPGVFAEQGATEKEQA